jgi:hypothetical protein
MRKLFLIGALVLIAAAAFAQAAAPAAAPTMAFTGALYTGTIAQSINGSTPSLGIWDPVNQTKSRFNFQGTINGGTWGLNFRLREDDNWQQGLDSNTPGMRRLYGWLEPVPGLIRVVVGRLSGYEWATGDAGGFSTLGNLDGAVGAQLQIKPIDGLNFGAFLPFTYGVSGTYIPNLDLAEALNFMAFGVKYTMKGVGDIEAGYWLAVNGFAINTGSSAFYQFAKAWFGLEYVGTQNLVALLESQFALSSNSAVNYSYFDEQVSYQLDQLGLTLYAEQLIWNSSATSATNSGVFLGFRPVVDYTVGNVDVGAYAEIVYTTNTTGYSGQVGYGFGPFVKLTVAKNVYMRLQPEYGGGNVTPPINGAPLQDYPGDNGSPAYQSANGLTQGWAPLANPYWQVFLNFVVSF